ncbi:hypothetical protein PF005_g21203 [Phytophthora fragariae]|nr:hypothetical protein PF003_g12731 [Phytophthora fragariae]KAE9003101.1 hypothetical protein PR002_g17433 [Phytophthora rubi]KAE8927650.1 hypothetical protein PF009_g22184 [Phytophthora fragariae]KAE8986466.1 hypothetical protein PF011_g19969 [Phytophthora fragariae]KAE9085225.1 hypothetical protein PF010_g20535 [Phytophthora fragariae]
MNQLIKNLEEEVKNVAQEETMISEFNKLIYTETKLLADEEAKREEKKRLITELMNNAGNLVLDSLHEHSNRKKVEANRLAKQAVCAADLQKLVQHFMHRVEVAKDDTRTTSSGFRSHETSDEVHSVAENECTAAGLIKLAAYLFGLH